MQPDARDGLSRGRTLGSKSVPRGGHTSRGPDYSSNSGSLLIDTDRASLQLGKDWWGLPDETPAHCQATVRSESRPSAFIQDRPYVIRIYVFGFPKDRWPHARNDGVAGLLDDIDELYGPDEDTVATFSVSVNQAAHSWLADYCARLDRDREVLEEELAALEQEIDARSAAERDAGAQDAANVAGRDHYLAVATAPPAGRRIEPGNPGYFGIGWHTESHHDAGANAVAACRRQGGASACSFNAAGTTLRGGCVGLAMAKWRDRNEDAERTYVVTSSSFRDLVARDLRTACESAALGGKHEGTVLEHSCEMVDIVCADDVVADSATP